MKLTTVSTDEDITRIQTEGDITQMDFRAGTDVLGNLLGTDCYKRKVLLSLEKTSYIDSTAVGWIIRCHKHCKEAGGKLVIHSISPSVLQVLRLLRMPNILHMAENDAAARALAVGVRQ
jgi:anti-anti-sigma factor